MRVNRMLSVRGATYRVSKVCDHTYEVVRIIDDHRMGTFEANPGLCVTTEGDDSSLVREIAYRALKRGMFSSAAPLQQI
jgi:hypothetical protein